MFDFSKNYLGPTLMRLSLTRVTKSYLLALGTTLITLISPSTEVVSKLPPNRLESLEWSNILCVILYGIFIPGKKIVYGIFIPGKKIAADWLSKSDRFQAFPPCLKKLEEEVILVQPDRTAYLEREYVQFIRAGSVATFAGGPWGYGCT